MGKGKGEALEERPVCTCPFCEVALMPPFDFCKPCNIKLLSCPECNQLVAEGKDTCPHCGAKIGG